MESPPPDRSQRFIESSAISTATASEPTQIDSHSLSFARLLLSFTFAFFPLILLILRVKMQLSNSKAALLGAICFLPCTLGAAMPVKRALSSVVNGKPIGFAAGVTGGGDAAAVYPKTIDDLKKYLTSKDPQVIVIDGEYDFAGSEGTQTEQACNGYPCTPENGGQALLNTLNGCTEATYDVEIDTAAYQGIQVQSDKTLVGKNGATLNGTCAK